MTGTMTVESVAAGMYLTIDQRLRAPETVAGAGNAVEILERRALMKPGGLLRSLEQWRIHQGDPMSMYNFVSWLMMDGIDPHIGQATGRSRDYWLGLLSRCG
jgi:hypothetical protein